jgi:iodotyrosine deiodinase
MPEPRFFAHRPPRLTKAEMLRRGREFYEQMNERRSVRHFAPDPVPRELIELAIVTASTAPSAAHRQPWCFVAVSEPATKRAIRLAAEAEERKFYEGGSTPAEWLEALAPLGMNWKKTYLEIAPWLVAVFAEEHAVAADGHPLPNYHVEESVGIACGFFVAAIHQMGLVTLPHTPRPMYFLSEILGRPPHQKPYVLFPVGYAAPEAQVPNLERKTLAQVSLWDPVHPAAK